MVSNLASWLMVMGMCSEADCRIFPLFSRPAMCHIDCMSLEPAQVSACQRQCAGMKSSFQQGAVLQIYGSSDTTCSSGVQYAIPLVSGQCISSLPAPFLGQQSLLWTNFNASAYWSLQLYEQMDCQEEVAWTQPFTVGSWCNVLDAPVVGSFPFEVVLPQTQPCTVQQYALNTECTQPFNEYQFTPNVCITAATDKSLLWNITTQEWALYEFQDGQCEKLADVTEGPLGGACGPANMPECTVICQEVLDE